MNLTAIFSAVALAIGLSTGFGAAWHLRTATIEKLKATYDQANMDAERAAFRKSETNSAKIITAQAGAAVRVRRNVVADSGAVAAGNGLRFASDDALRAAKDSLSACTSLAAEYDSALRKVVDFAQRASAESGAWEASAIEHHQGWPQ